MRHNLGHPISYTAAVENLVLHCGRIGGNHIIHIFFLSYRLVLVVIVVFCVCWAPIQIILLLKALDLYSTNPPEEYPKIILQIFAHVLAYLNRYASTNNFDFFLTVI